eukprot:TRINITY_DN9074_c0_g1_i1.p1 TRINITY_DN9074_c0_g1~~TRINITY_DN9074_c0_g1_i1.p1  ORF type:complete len:486 (-),score=123.90 TRINITY_DN9074_c0_g1_i1:186-1643(-)
MGLAQELAAGAALLLAIAVAGAGHWKLGSRAPIWDAAGLARRSAAACQSPEAKYAALAAAGLPQQPAADVLVQGISQWTGRPEAAQLHAALGHIHLSSGDVKKALAQFRQASSEAERSGGAAASSAAGLRLDLRVREAELLLKTGKTQDAIEAMSAMLTLDTAGAPGSVVAVQARGLRLLVAALLKLGPSEDEIALVEQTYRSTFENLQKRAGPEALSTLYEGVAALAEARADFGGAAEALGMAIKQLQQARDQIDSLVRQDDRLMGDLAMAVRLGCLFERLAAVVDAAERARHASPDAGRAAQPADSSAAFSRNAQSPDAYRARAVEVIWEDVLFRSTDVKTGGVTGDCPLLRSALDFSHGVLRRLAVTSLDRDPESAERHARRSLKYASWLRSQLPCRDGEATCDMASETASGLWATMVSSRAEAVLSEVAKRRRWRRLLARTTAERPPAVAGDLALQTGRWDDLWPPLIEFDVADQTATLAS